MKNGNLAIAHDDSVTSVSTHRYSIKLRDAALCINCDTIYSIRPGANELSSNAASCPDCGSRQRLVLTRIVEPVG